MISEISHFVIPTVRYHLGYVSVCDTSQWYHFRYVFVTPIDIISDISDFVTPILLISFQTCLTLWHQSMVMPTRWLSSPCRFEHSRFTSWSDEPPDNHPFPSWPATLWFNIIHIIMTSRMWLLYWNQSWRKKRCCEVLLFQKCHCWYLRNSLRKIHLRSKAKPHIVASTLVLYSRRL